MSDHKDDLLIGQLLIRRGLITSEQLERALQEQRKSGGFICTVIVQLGFSSEDELFGVLSEQLGIPHVGLRDKSIDPSVIRKVPAKFANHYKIIPVEFDEYGLVVAMADPLDIRTLDDLRLLLGCDVKGVLAGEKEILSAIRAHYGVGAQALETMLAGSPSGLPEGALEGASSIQGEQERLDILSDASEDASIISFVNQILAEAIKDRATDIHLEPFQDELRCRYRIDGVLYDVTIPDTIKYFHQKIVARIKIMAQLNIVERRLPQDGRIKIRVNDLELDLRLSTMPTSFGEGVHIRVLNNRFFLELEKLGMFADDLAALESVIRRPHGVLFVTGPTGSGKSTTLYAALARRNSPDVKIITIEDPVEYQLRGVNQVQVNPAIGFTFATALRHMLRHDPDIMMVGEVRDFETAEIAIRSALTGHLVFSTLHTNDSAGGVTRLLDMGVEPFLVASSIECLIAQRLVRLICPDCRQAVPAKRREEIMHEAGGEVEGFADAALFEGVGCRACRMTGYRGRTGIYEVLLINEHIRELIIARASSQQIRQYALTQGLRTLRHDGLRKVKEGMTTFTEVLRVTQQEERT